METFCINVSSIPTPTLLWSELIVANRCQISKSVLKKQRGISSLESQQSKCLVQFPLFSKNEYPLPKHKGVSSMLIKCVCLNCTNKIYQESPVLLPIDSVLH